MIARALDRVLADLRREGRWNLFLTADLKWARHGERGARPRVVDGHQSAARPHLDIVRNVVERGDDAERDAGVERQAERAAQARAAARISGGASAGSMLATESRCSRITSSMLSRLSA